MKDTSLVLSTYKKIPTPEKGFFKTFFAYFGPGLMIAVGYMDPGNWATDIEGGSKFGYSLLSVIFISNLMAILLQYLALKLGIASGENLAELSKSQFKKSTNFLLWILCEIAIIACDVAEIIGAAIALKLLFHIPILIGSIITVLDVFIILALTNKSFRTLEIFITVLIVTIASAFLYNLIAAQPPVKEMLAGLVPSSEIILNKEALFIAVGILGATVMPHNLYLHSAIVQTRSYPNTVEGKKRALFFCTLDSTLSLLFAFFINSAILILAAAAFHEQHMIVTEIEHAYKLLSPVLQNTVASALFAIALLAAGQNSSITGTLAGQIVMEGFLDLKISPFLRRTITRCVAVIPVIFCIIFFGGKSVNFLLILSQVILSLQLPFAVIPLIMFTSSKKVMNSFHNKMPMKIASWIVASIILILNLYLIVYSVM